MASLTSVVAKLDAAAIGRHPNVRHSVEAKVVCANAAGPKYPSTEVSRTPGANLKCICCHNGCNDRQDGYKSDHGDLSVREMEHSRRQKQRTQTHGVKEKEERGERRNLEHLLWDPLKGSAEAPSGDPLASEFHHNSILSIQIPIPLSIGRAQTLLNVRHFQFRSSLPPFRRSRIASHLGLGLQ